MRSFLWFSVIFSAVVIIFSSGVLWVGMDQRLKDEKRSAEAGARDSNVYYEIFVRSFYDSDGDGIGDLNGVTEKLDYLQSLGISGIWLMPINPSPSYHGYDVTDYYDIHPDYGTIGDLERLVGEAHKREIRIIMDLVINHTSSKHPWFIESASDANSAKQDWYIWAGETNGTESEAGAGVNTNAASAIGGKAWHARSGGHYLGIFWDGMPDLNLDHPEVRAEMIRIGQFWLEKGVDGFRLDAAKHVYEDLQGDSKSQDIAAKNIEWWQAFRQGLDSVNEEAYLVGEVWDTASVIGPYLDHALDAAFNFDLAGQLISMASDERAVDIGFSVGRIHDYYASVSGGAFEDAVFLSNHDQNRVMSQLKGNIGHAKMAASMLLTLPGKPYIYYGEEIGMQGVKPDERIREPMVWFRDASGGAGQTTWESRVHNRGGEASVEAQLADEDSLLNHYRKLIRLRASEPALRSGTIASYSVDAAEVVAYERMAGSSDGIDDVDRVLVLHNLSAEPVNVELENGRGGTGAMVEAGDTGNDYTELVYSSRDGYERNGARATIPGYTTVVLK